MDDRADTLRRRVALYRSYLAEGVSAGLAIVYLCEIAEAEAGDARLPAGSLREVICITAQCDPAIEG